MANNRIYIVDDERKEYIFFGKGWGAGWDVWVGESPLEEFMRCRDMASSYNGRVKTCLRFATEIDDLTGYECLIWSNGQWVQRSTNHPTPTPPAT